MLHILTMVKLRLLLCEAGDVTEELIPRSYLNEVDVTRVNGEPLGVSWYYQYLKVDRYFENDGFATCVIEIPLTQSEPFLSEPIFTYPIKRGEGVIQIHHNVWVALGTITGGIFYP